MNLRAHIPSCMIAIWLLSLCVYGQHPVVLDEHSQCVECHEGHAAGAHVHAAVKKGCTACHRVEKRADATYVELKAGKSVACFECHQGKEYTYAHFPYAAGMCTRCHNPHSSANARLLRAKVNELCLDCHLQQAKTPSSPYMPAISLTSDKQTGHPYARHPVSGIRDPLTREEMTCLSCHEAHGAAKLHDLKMGAEIPGDALTQPIETKDLCENCHFQQWGVGDVVGKKKKIRK